MAEARYFLKCLDHTDNTQSPMINNEAWEAAKTKTYAKYALSRSLPYLMRCVQLFEKTNRAKYYSDLRDFMFESSVEDFCDVSDADVVVSTIHKAKGHEFDHVFMLVTDPQHPTDDVLRRYYVAMTRAKQTLTIHTNGSLFDTIPADHRLAIPSTGRDIAMLSMKMQGKLGAWEAKGYQVTAAKIRFIAAWKPKEATREEKESAIVLADLVLRK